MKNTLEKTIIDLWHLSRTALYGKPQSRRDRMQYIKFELNRTYPKLIEGMTNKQVWFTIEETTQPTTDFSPYSNLDSFAP